ncbi:MAG: T9SS type A sorting domain-containing protein [Bacteroidales bacterium]|nr:T9SS type A sorting domain-containing protein [Bacteroidales bacterium]
MKTKLLFTFISLLIAGFISAQSLVLTYEGEDLEPSAVISIEDLASTYEIIVDMDVTNTSTSDLDILVQRYEEEMVPGSSSLFCWGLCYDTAISLSPYAIPIAAGETIISGFQGHYRPYNNVGQSTISYTFFDENNPNDSVMVVVHYNGLITGIDNEKKLNASVFPNPANDLLHIEIPQTNTTMFDIEILNITGALVKTIKANTSTMEISTRELGNGIYVYRILEGNKLISTDRFIVQH